MINACKVILIFVFQEEREGAWYIESTSQEVGIDVPSEKPHHRHGNDTTSTNGAVGSSTSSTSLGGMSVLAPLQPASQPSSSLPTKSTSLHSLNSQSSSPRGSMTRLSTQTSLEQEQPSRGSMRGRAATMATNSMLMGNRGRSPGAKMTEYHRSASPLLNTIGLARADGMFSCV